MHAAELGAGASGDAGEQHEQQQQEQLWQQERLLLPQLAEAAAAGAATAGGSLAAEEPDSSAASAVAASAAAADGVAEAAGRSRQRGSAGSSSAAAEGRGDHVATSAASSSAGGFGPPPEGEAAERSGTDNAVSALQELIQSCSSFSPHTKILTWTFEQQLEQGNSLEFRATVSFVLGDVPHHFCGGWQSSKKKAQRDTAERVTRYLQQARAAGAPLQAEESTSSAANVPAHAALHPRELPDEVLRELAATHPEALRSGLQLPEAPLCSEATTADGASADGSGALEWKIERRAGEAGSEEVRATVTFYIHEVPHHFCGSWCPILAPGADGADTAQASRPTAEQAAMRDTAERVLWYFDRSEEGFAAMERTVVNDRMMPPLVAPGPGAEAAVVSRAAGASATSTASSPEKLSVLDDKTVLMQVQNVLQKVFARDTPPGQRVWLWSYEADPSDPQLFRACVGIPSWGNRTFTGEWCRGKKLAQRKACLVVKAALEAAGLA